MLRFTDNNHQPENIMKTLLNTLILSILALFPGLLPASDLEREQRWQTQVEENLFEGETLMLNDGSVDFLGIYTEAAQVRPEGAVLLLHGRGVHPDWPQVISPLRTRLPEQGWATLSLQMPVLDPQAKLDAYVPLFDEALGRIEAGIDYLQEQGFDRIVLLGHSMGNGMATHYLATTRDPRVKGFIGVGMSADKPELRSVMDTAIALRKLALLPVLDVYGSRDIDLVLDSVGARFDAIRSAGSPRSQQVMLRGSDHFHDGSEEKLTSVIVDWLGVAVGRCWADNNTLASKQRSY
jgi:dienelactone hydrolase